MKKLFVCLFCLLISCNLCGCASDTPSETIPMATQLLPLQGYVIALDAGHGGRDQGALGSKGISEAQLNLLVVKELALQLQQVGAKVLMTRTEDAVVYDDGAGTLKLRDMRYRVHLINESECDILISVHMNYFQDAQYKGAQAFYQSGSENGFLLAQAIQQSVVLGLQPENNRKIQPEDFYMLRETECPAVLVECGFLSNAQEEEQLCDPIYRTDLCRYIVQGISTYLGCEM